MEQGHRNKGKLLLYSSSILQLGLCLLSSSIPQFLNNNTSFVLAPYFHALKKIKKHSRSRLLLVSKYFLKRE